MPQAEILSIGNELLNGRIADTNAQWMGRTLLDIGLPLARVTVVPDVLPVMRQALADALQRSEVVILSGGLGPTQDDLTKPMLLDYFGGKLVLHQPTLQRLEAWFTARGRPFNDLNRGQAMLPDNCVVLENQVGTAQGMQFETADGRLVFSLPGVPHELKHLTERYLLPLLRARFTSGYLRQHTLRTVAVPESELALRLADIENHLPEGFLMAYNPGLGTVDVRLALRGDAADRPRLDAEFDGILVQMRNTLGNAVYGEQTETLPEAIGKLLRAHGLKLAIAESCTGGALSAAFVALSGTSDFYTGGIVSYDNDVKVDVLGVPRALIDAHGAVSEEVALQMAHGAAQRLGTGVAVSTTGIAGPDGGSDEKPVGTVWIGVHTPRGTVARKFLFEKDRLRNIQRSVVMAQSLLLHELRKLA